MTKVPEGAKKRFEYCCKVSGEWRNWQTRRLQVPVFERMCGFKSRLAHHVMLQSFWDK